MSFVVDHIQANLNHCIPHIPQIISNLTSLVASMHVILCSLNYTLLLISCDLQMISKAIQASIYNYITLIHALRWYAVLCIHISWLLIAYRWVGNSTCNRLSKIDDKSWIMVRRWRCTYLDPLPIQFLKANRNLVVAGIWYFANGPLGLPPWLITELVAGPTTKADRSGLRLNLAQLGQIFQKTDAKTGPDFELIGF